MSEAVIGHDVFDIAEGGPRVGTFPVPGALLGFADDDVLLFTTWGTEGITRVSADGLTVEQIPFPAWVTREGNGPPGTPA